MAPKIQWPKMPKLPTIFKTKHQLNQEILDREDQITDLKEQISQYRIIKANLLRRLNSVPNPNTDQLLSDLRAQVSRLQEIIIRNGTWNFTLVLHVNLCTCDVRRGVIDAVVSAGYARYAERIEDLEQRLEEEMMVSFELEQELEREKLVSEGLREQILRGKEGGRRNSI